MSKAKLISDLRKIADILETAKGLVISRNYISIEQDATVSFLGAEEYFSFRGRPIKLRVDLEAQWRDYMITEEEDEDD